MRVPKNRSMYRILVAPLFLCFVNISASGMSEICEQQNKSFEINQPLSEWPEVPQLSKEEELCYDLTWDINKRLEENQQELVKNFISSCCDFSFKLEDMGLSGIYPGKFDDDERVVFIDKETRISVNHGSNDIMFFNEKDGIKRLKIYPRTAVLQDIKPVSFQEWMRYEFERFIQRFVEDPVGCEILRVSIAKYEAGQRGLSKIRFIPQRDPQIDLAYTPGSYAWKYARRIGRSEFSRYAEFCRENKFIIFSPEWFNTDQTGLILKLRKTKFGTDNFSVDTGVMPREAGLMYQIIYSIHVGKGMDYDGTYVIEKRDDQNYFCGNFDGVGPFSILRKILNISIFKNDKIYRAMYGLTKRGFDLVNESAYLAHKYDFIRAAYAGKAGIVVNGKRLDKKKSSKLFKKFLKTNGDFDLFWHYLSSESSIQYPEFGIGSYRCADVDFEKKERES